MQRGSRGTPWQQQVQSTHSRCTDHQPWPTVSLDLAWGLAPGRWFGLLFGWVEAVGVAKG
eukprot:3560357-Karenia_brevis.AAC.1